MTKTERFLDLYKKLEMLSANFYDMRSDGGTVSKLTRRSEFRNIRAELDYIRDVRNLLTHRPRISNAYAVEPTDAMIALLEDVIRKIEFPLNAERIMIPLDEVVSCSRNDRVIPTLKKMYEKAITHIPVMEKGKVTGVFSDSTFIHCTISAKHRINPETAFHEIEEELPLNRHEAEQFLFAARNATAMELSDIFDEGERTGKKVGMIFVTEHGRSDEKLLGIVTAWDVATAFRAEC